MIYRDLDPIRIDLDAIYAEGALCLLLGMTSSALARARRAGDLKHRRLGRVVLYRGEWVMEWLLGESITPGRKPGGGAP